MMQKLIQKKCMLSIREKEAVEVGGSFELAC